MLKHDLNRFKLGIISLLILMAFSGVSTLLFASAEVNAQTPDESLCAFSDVTPIDDQLECEGRSYDPSQSGSRDIFKFTNPNRIQFTGVGPRSVTGAIGPGADGPLAGGGTFNIQNNGDDSDLVIWQRDTIVYTGDITSGDCTRTFTLLIKGNDLKTRLLDPVADGDTPKAAIAIDFIGPTNTDSDEECYPDEFESWVDRVNDAGEGTRAPEDALGWVWGAGSLDPRAVDATLNSDNRGDDADNPLPDDTGENENQDNCDAGTGLIDGFLGFVICPFVESILGMIQWAETNVIIPYLIINPLGTEEDNAVYLMWQALRNIAFVLLVVAFMYLVFAETTALGGEAYQLKRLAPRLVMVTIAISLSYLAIGLVIDFFNVLGLGIAQITAWAMKEVGQQPLVTVETDLGSASLMALIVGTGALALTSALIGGSLAAPIIGIAAVTGIFIVLAVVITLILRQVVIMGLVILSPLAFVSLLLPNTEKLFKTWWSVITKALVMYPLIMLLFAAGKIFGSIISAEAGTGPAEEAIRDLLGFLANIAPMALIPFTFKISGGAIGGAWGAMRGGISKGRKTALGSEHNPRSVLYKGREKSYKNMSERMAGQRSWLPRVPFMRNRRVPLNQRATSALTGAPLIGGWMAGNERIAGARADAEKRIKELAATPIGLERLREEAYGSEEIDAIHPNHGDHGHKPVPGNKREAAKHRANHQRQIMVAKTLGASKEDGGSDERTRHFAQNIKKRVDRKEISAKQGDELWEEFSRAAVSHNPLLLASTQTAGGVRASREAFATDTSLFGATTAGVGAAGTAAAGTAVSIAGSGKAAVAEQLLSNEGVVQDLITRAGRSGNTDQLSVHTDKALETIFTPDAAGNLSAVAQNMLASGSNRGKLKEIVLKLEGRNRSSTAAVAADAEAAGYNVTPEQSVVGQEAAKVIRDAIYKVDPNFAPGVTGAPVVPPTRI